MPTITLSEKTLKELHQAAAVRGQDPDSYADELLEISLAVLKTSNVFVTGKKHRVMEFCGAAPTGRTAAEIDAEIEAGRTEWDTAERS